MNKLFIAGLLIVFSLAGCSAESASNRKGPEVKTVNVETVDIQPTTFERYLRLIGTVESENDVQLSAEISGRIERYYVDEGEYVQRNEAILKINDDKLQQQVDQLKAQVVQAREQYERLKRLYEQESIGSEINVINARTTYQQRKAALEARKVDLANTTVRAPFSGVVDRIIIETGEMAAPGKPLVRLISTGNLTITAGVPSRFANAVTTEDSAIVWFDIQPVDTLRLPITYVSRSINEESRTFDIEIELPASAQNYKVDMKTNLKLKTFVQDSAVVINRQYIYPAQENFAVFTLAENDSSQLIAKRQIVTLGPAYNNNVLIESGLSFGDRLITAGSSFLQDSMRVRITGNTVN